MWIITATAIVHDKFVRAYVDLPVDEVIVVHMKNVSVAHPTSFPIETHQHMFLDY